jgi:hypothetical protein
LRDAFVGYVVPSKIHACIDSGKRILFIGSPNSDVHLLASAALPSGRYRRVDAGDVDGLVKALQSLEAAITSECQPNVVRLRRSMAPESSRRRVVARPSADEFGKSSS